MASITENKVEQVGGGPPVWTRYLRLRASSTDFPVVQRRAVDPETGFVEGTRQRPRTGGPAAPNGTSPGTLLGLQELVVRPAGAPLVAEPDAVPTVPWWAFLTGVAVVALLVTAAVARSVMRSRVTAHAPWPAPTTMPTNPYAPPAPSRDRRRLSWLRPPPRPVGAERGARATVDRMAQVAAYLVPLPLLLLVPALPLIIIPLAGFLVLVAVGFLVTGIGAVLAGLALGLQVAAAATGGTLWRQALLRTLPLAVLYGGVLFALLDAGQDDPVDEDRVRALPRPLAVTAEPAAVVARALALADSANPSAMCGLLAPSAKDECRPPDTAFGTTRPSLVQQQGDQAVVYYGTDVRETLAVRLVRSARGWELLALPGEDPDACVSRAVKKGRDALRWLNPRFSHVAGGRRVLLHRAPHVGCNPARPLDADQRLLLDRVGQLRRRRRSPVPGRRRPGRAGHRPRSRRELCVGLRRLHVVAQLAGR